MKVYLCCEYNYDYCNEYHNVVLVVDDEVKALIWKEEKEYTDTEWRDYVEMEVK